MREYTIVDSSPFCRAKHRLWRTCGAILFSLLATVFLAGCSSTRQLSIAPAEIDEATSPAFPLIVEEHAITPDELDSAIRSGWDYEIPEEVFERRQPWRVSLSGQRIREVNQVLDSSGYRVVSKNKRIHRHVTVFSYDLYRESKLIASDLTNIGPVEVNEDQDDFVLLMRGPSETLLIHTGSVEQRPDLVTSPVFVGNDLVTVTVENLGSLKPGDPRQMYQCTVWRRGKAVYTRTLPPPVMPPVVRNLESWQGQWVLEIDEQAIVDGQSLNEELGYDAIFHWQLLKGRPFYFFRKDDHVGVSYDGKVLPYRYDEVVHYECCEPAMFNIGGNNTMVWFHALRDGMWHYVEMGVYEE